MESSKTTARPWPIIFLSFVAFFGTVLGIWAFAREVSETGFHAKAITTLGLAVGLLLPFINIYRMKKSGFYLYSLLFILAQGLAIYKGTWSVVGLVMPVSVLAVFLFYRKKLD